MKRLRLTGPDVYEPRLDDFDLHSIGIEASKDFGRHVSELVRSADDGPVVVHGFTVERINDTDLRVHRGAAVLGLVDDGATRFGQLASEGAASRVVSLSTQPHGTVGIYVWFAYVWGDPAQMAYAKPDGTEGVRQQNTRDVPEWFAVASVGAPADPAISGIAYKVADISWDGTLTHDDIHDTRTLLFEGQGSGGANPAEVWTIPSSEFYREDPLRSSLGIKNLSQWIFAVAKRLEEFGGRKWYSRLGYNENVRSASADILVSPSAGQEKAVHLVLSADTAERVNELTTRIEQPGAGGDPRTTLRFVPTSGGNRPTINLDTTAFPVQAVSPANARRTVAGSASLTRTAGNNPVLRTVGFEGELRDLHFGGTVGNACLVQGASVSDDVTFIGCTFAADSLTQPAVRITAGGTYRFIGCTFTAPSGQNCLTIEAAARVTVEGCDFTTGAEGIDASVAPAILEVTGSRFSSTRGINVNAAGGTVSLEGNTFTGTTAWRRLSTFGEIVRLVAEPQADHRNGQFGVPSLRVAEPSIEITTEVPLDAGSRRHPIFFGRRPDADSPFIGADIDNDTGSVASFDFMRARVGDPAVFADARARKLYLTGDAFNGGALGFSPARNASGLRLARLMGNDTELRVLDAAGDTPVASVIGAKRIRLGGRLYGNSMLPRVVGTIEWQKAWEAGGAEKQDRRTNAGVGFFESAIRLGEGGDGGITVTALDAAGDPWAAGLIANHHFRVAGLAMGTTDYVVVAHLTTNVDVSKLGGLTSIKKVEVVVCNQTSDGFDLVPVLGTEGWPCYSNPNADFSEEDGDGYRLVFQVCRLVD